MPVINEKIPFMKLFGFVMVGGCQIMETVSTTVFVEREVADWIVTLDWRLKYYELYNRRFAML